MPPSSPHRACEDFHRTAATPRHPRVGVTRRHLLGWGAGAGVSLYAARALPLQHWMEGADAAHAQDPGARILVSVFLPGGLDLLDSFTDMGQFPAYSEARGEAARSVSGDVLPGTTVSPHPSFATGQNGGLRQLYLAGKVGLLPGIDYANPDLSHFHSRRFWETGIISAQQTTGWLGRWLDRHGSASNPFQGISAGARLSPTLLTSQAPVSSIESARRSELLLEGATERERERIMLAYDQLSRPRAGDGEGRAAVRASARYAKEIADKLRPLYNAGPGAPAAGGDVDAVTGVDGSLNG